MAFRRSRSWDACTPRDDTPDTGRGGKHHVSGWGRCRGRPMKAGIGVGPRLPRAGTRERRACRCGANAQRVELQPRRHPASRLRSAPQRSPPAHKRTSSHAPRILSHAAAANAGSGVPPAAAAPPPPPPRGRMQLRPRWCGGRRLLRALRRARRRALQLRSRGADAGAPPRRPQRGRVRD